MKTRRDLDQIIEAMNLPYVPSELQREDAMQAYIDGSFAFFYEVGGGKTLAMTMTALLHGVPAVILVPHILIPQWERWFHKIGQHDVSIYYGPKRTTEAFKAKFVLTSHDIFRRDEKLFTAHYRGRRVLLGVDEAQKMKSFKSKLFKMVKGFVEPDKPLVLATATPTSKPEDTYSYMKVKSPGLYRSFTHWEQLHVESRDIFGTITAYSNQDLLANNFAIKSVKRTKKELFGYDIKPIIDPIPYELDSKHLKLYNELKDEMLIEFTNGEIIDATTPQKLRHKLQQIIWNWGMFTEDPDLEFGAAGFTLLESICDELDFMNPKNTKLIIWTNYRATSALITKWMMKRYGANTGGGAYGGVNAAETIHRLMFDDSFRWTVANPLSVGAGLELQHVCSYMVFAEMITTSIPNRQAVGRFDRPGQRDIPTAALLLAQRTVQPKMFEDLLINDDRVSKIERNPESLRQLLESTLAV